ncbi:MAG: hypothetical protein AB7G80_03415 [Dongiaceae bacterium]
MPLPPSPPEPIIKDEEVLHQSGWQTVLKTTLGWPEGVTPPTNQTEWFDIKTGNGVIVVPVDLEREEVVAVNSFRLPLRHSHSTCWQWEFPGGVVPKGSIAQDRAPIELIAETGLQVKQVGQVHGKALYHLGRCSTTSGRVSELTDLFVASIDAEQVLPEAGIRAKGEFTLTARVSIAEMDELIAKGVFFQATGCLAFERFLRHRQEIEAKLRGR